MLKVDNVSFQYDKKNVLSELSFTVEKGYTFAIIGESGCGKSTLLKLVYGLYDLAEGQIFWKEHEILGPKYNLIPGMSFMKYLAQDFDLMPFITVAENVGKYLSNFYPEEKKERVSTLLEIVEMTEFANIKAKNLSGGQMQRVALARVLALEPEVLLLDEPFSHIDNFRKNSLRRKLFTYLKEKNITTIVATHDCTDVLSFADEVLVLKQGQKIVQEKPFLLFNQPNSIYTASLFGEVNEISGQYFNEITNNLLYPHQLTIVENSPLKVEVIHSYFKGSHYLIQSKYEEGVIFFAHHESIQKGTVLFLNQK
jgi:ABC-type sulfate/molybdate transport systems ATPase subunit